MLASTAWRYLGGRQAVPQFSLIIWGSMCFRGLGVVLDKLRCIVGLSEG